jgi:hypothetical protein
MANLLSINEITSFAMTTCKSATPEDRLLFRVWSVAACRDIGPSTKWYKVETLYPKDFVLCKPDDLVSTAAIALYNSGCGQIPYKYNPGAKRVNTSRFMINTEVEVQSRGASIDLSEDSHYFYLSSNATEVTHAEIRYLAMPVDRDGYPMIPEDHLLAYEAFCRWMWAKRQDDNRSKIDQDYQFWVRERDRIKAKSKMPSQLEGEAIFKRYLSLISEPSFNSF